MNCKLILIRGLPGSGKSTIAKILSKAGFVHLEADTYHLNSDGDYCFDAANIKKAHEWCQQETRKELESGNDVVVSNTFTQAWELAPYLDIAKSLGIEPNILIAKGYWENIHSVPTEVLTKMRNRWEDDTTTELHSELAASQAEVARLKEDIEHWRFQADEAGTTLVMFGEQLTAARAEIEKTNALLDMWLWETVNQREEHAGARSLTQEYFKRVQYKQLDTARSQGDEG